MQLFYLQLFTYFEFFFRLLFSLKQQERDKTSSHVAQFSLAHFSAWASIQGAKSRVWDQN